jgi:hypothetical protein
MASKWDRISSLTFGKATGLMTGIAGSMAVLWVCWQESNTVTSLCALVGGCLGWLTGIIIAPLTDQEAKKFDVMAKVISGFVTGYLLSKIDPLISHLVTIDATTKFAPIARPEIATRALLTLASYMIAVLMVFCARVYWSPQKPQTSARRRPMQPTLNDGKRNAPE